MSIHARPQAQFAHSVLSQSEIDEQLGTMEYSAVSRGERGLVRFAALKI